MMGGVQRWLAVLTLSVCVAISLAQLDVSLAKDARFNKMLPEPQLPTDEEATATIPHGKLPMANNPKFNKMLPEPQPDRHVGILKEEPLSSSTKSFTGAPVHFKKTTVVHPTKSSAAKTSDSLNSVKSDIAHSEIGKNHVNADDADKDDDYYYDYKEYYDDNDDKTPEKKADKKTTIVQNKEIKDWKLKPIKGDEKNTLEDEHKQHIVGNLENDIVEPSDYDENDDADDEDEDDDDEYESDVDEIIQNVTKTKTSVGSTSTETHQGHSACPMNCICELNFNGFRVANCDRLDVGTMKFDSSITDLEILNVPPKYPLVLDAEFFKKIGLSQVSSIKIVDSTIESIHPTAFHGLDQLYSVNLTNTGLDMLHPDTFESNKKLRILTLSGNDLHAMQQKSSPFVDYMLKAPSIEELYLSRCNIKTLLSSAFTKLDNIVFISLADNLLTTLPHGIFNRLETLEELDLSSNSFENLPRHIFENTSLSILNLRYNEFYARPNFLGHELQKLDLSYNKLVNINDLMFTDMKGLNNLNLKGNMIRKIHHAAFSPLKDLRHIDLSFNDLEQVSALLFMTNVDLDTIRMNDNSRLKKLPMEGFTSERKSFNVYLFDASNCDLSELGDNTFSTMPQLTTLNLSWNNIEILNKGIFSFLEKLVKIDLSNNLISDLHDLLFLHNRNIRKMNLAGNPLGKISPKVFLPTKQLNDLDLSDCNLKMLWTEPTYKKPLFKNLKTLNVSNNEIEQMSVSELESMDRLAVLDLSNNKMKCGQEFKELMRWLNTKKVTSGQLRHFIRESSEHALANVDNVTPWEEYQQLLCSKSTKQVIDTENKLIVDSDENGTEDEDEEDDDIIDDVLRAHNTNEEKEDDDEYDTYDEEDDEEEIKLSDEVTDHGIVVEQSIVKNVVKSTKKPSVAIESGDDEDNDDGDDDEYDEDDDIRVQAEYTFIAQYGYLIPIAVVVFTVILVLLSVGKLLSILMHRRGERYRQALLASKNSIVYQKLSEEIGTPTTPKFHRYAPIQQV